MDRNAYTNNAELRGTAVETARRLRQDKAAAESLAKARELLAQRRATAQRPLIAALAILDVLLVAFAITRAF